MIMEYNTTRDPLIISEYGRNIQNIVQHITTIEDREQRSRMVRSLVNVLSLINPEFLDLNELKQKLYDHMHIMANFKLDIDSPYPVPPRPEEAPKPKRVPYNQGSIKLRPYGKYMQRMIEKAVTYEEGPEKEELVKTIANNLKKMYLNWNRDSVNDELIHEHLKLLSGSQLKLRDDDKLHSTVDILKANSQVPKKPKSNDFKKKKFIGKKPDSNGHRKKYSK